MILNHSQYIWHDKRRVAPSPGEMNLRRAIQEMNLYVLGYEFWLPLNMWFDAAVYVPGIGMVLLDIDYRRVLRGSLKSLHARCHKVAFCKANNITYLLLDEASTMMLRARIELFLLRRRNHE